MVPSFVDSTTILTTGIFRRVLRWIYSPLRSKTKTFGLIVVALARTWNINKALRRESDAKASSSIITLHERAQCIFRPQISVTLIDELNQRYTQLQNAFRSLKVVPMMFDT
jgi:hypothetical protein